MYKISLTLVVFFKLFWACSKLSRYAVYESKTSTADFKARMAGNRNITPEMQKNMEEGWKCLKNIFEFWQTASIYKEERLEGPTQGGGMRMMSSMNGSGGTMYKMSRKNITLLIKSWWVRILVKDSASLNWKMERKQEWLVLQLF
jgi:hypothetical protein